MQVRLGLHVWCSMIKGMQIYYTIRLMLFTVIAVLIGIQARFIIEADVLHYLVSSVMILFGLEGIIYPIIKDYKKFYVDAQFYLGHVDLILGLVVITTIRKLDYVCMIWATWTIVREAFDLYEVGHKAMHGFPAFLSLALSITEIVFSVFMLIEATEHHALTHIYLLIPEFIINGLAPLLFDIHTKRKKKKEKPAE